MEYKFLRTINGPAILGEDEVLFLSQFQQLVDYIDSDPEFLEKAKKHVSDEIRSMGNDIADSMYTAVLGGDQTGTLHMYLSALNVLSQLEFSFIPSLKQH